MLTTMPKIPVLGAISVPDAILLDNMASRGKPIRIRVDILSTTKPGTAWNVVGDLPGDGSSQEVIVIGGHLDSWDPEHSRRHRRRCRRGHHHRRRQAGRPASRGRKRTIRVIMFGAEEMDYASDAWGAAHKAEFGHFALTSESDNGADNIWALRLPAGGRDRPAFKALPELLKPLKIDVLPDAAHRLGR